MKTFAAAGLAFTLTLAALPAVSVAEENSLTFNAGLTTDYGTGTFFPHEIRGNYDDAHLLARFQANPPDIVIHTADNAEFGGRFGVDYAQESWKWILANYTPAISLEKDNFLLILYRKGAPYPFPAVPPERRAQ